VLEAQLNLVSEKLKQMEADMLDKLNEKCTHLEAEFSISKKQMEEYVGNLHSELEAEVSKRRSFLEGIMNGLKQLQSQNKEQQTNHEKTLEFIKSIADTLALILENASLEHVISGGRDEKRKGMADMHQPEDDTETWSRN
jgi:uncharacterized coiled-coil protein SlyX